jgi:hypothetical protein
MSDPSQGDQPENSFSLLDRVKELIAEAETPVSVDPPAAVVEEAPLGWIEVKVLKWRWIDGFPIKDGYESHARPRTEADGDAEYIILATPVPTKYEDGSPVTAPEEAELPGLG